MKMNLTIQYGNGKRLKIPKIYENVDISFMGLLKDAIACKDTQIVALLSIVKNFYMSADGFFIEGLEDKSTTGGLKYTYQEWYCWFPSEDKEVIKNG